MSKPIIAGVDAGSSLIKVCWKTGETFAYASTANNTVEELRKALHAAGVTRVHQFGIGDTQGLTEGFEVVRPAIPASAAEILVQADGAKRLLAMTGPGGENDFLLVTIGTGTSYTMVEKGVARYLWPGNDLGGATMRAEAIFLGCESFDEFARLAEVGKSLDILIKERLFEYADSPLADLTLFHMGHATSSSSREDIAATRVERMARIISTDVIRISRERDMPEFEKVFFIGSMVGRMPVLRKHIEKYMRFAQKRANFHSQGEYALALGAYHWA